MGAKILNLDGTLQEAGCVLSRSGRPQFYGFGDDPAKPEYNVPRVVDYSSASCLLVRRRAFHDVGGFDPLFAPFYFEDVDLGLTFAARGWKTLYEPRSVVTHLRGASETEKEAAIQVWSHNETAFEARWRSFLAPYPRFVPPGGNRDLFLEARDLPACGGRAAHQGKGEP